MRLMSAGDGYKYLLASVAAGDGDRSLSTPLTRYYQESGNPPGWWIGSGVASLDCPLRPGDRVSELHLELLMGHGLHPLTGEQLGRPYAHYATAAERIDQRSRALDTKLTDAERAQTLSEIERQETERGTRKAVAGFDYTFSVPKSVSVLWGVADAGIQELIAQAHQDSIADVLGFMEAQVLATRTGSDMRDGSVVQSDVTGVVATAFDHYDSRAGDPQLHTHVVIANRVRTVSDGKWRTVDSRPMHAAIVTMSALYNALLADRITRVLGVGWDARERGHDRNPAWEITGVQDDLISEFSSRAHDIDVEKDRLIAAYVGEHGRRPSTKMILALRQQATLATRPEKQLHSLAELTEQWRGRASSLLGEDATSWARRVIAESDSIVIRTDDLPLDMVDALAASVLDTVGEKRSTWRRWNLHAEASRQTMGWRFASTGDREALTEQICDAAEQASLRLTPAEMFAPTEFLRDDGTSRFRPRNMTVYSSQDLLDAEQRLMVLAETFTAPVVSFDTVTKLVDQTDSKGLVLGPDQQDALFKIATSGRDLDVLVGPAGAGKTTALATLRRMWEAEHGPGSVVGLAPSATAAAILGEDLGIPAENTARWLALHDYTNLDFQRGQLVIIDEASLAGTFTLDRITSLAHQAGSKVLLVGDWAQLQAVDAGGAFTMLVANRADAPELTDIHRLTYQWEKPASLMLRHGDPAAINHYETHGRLAEGGLEDMAAKAYEAWRDDTAHGLASLLIADSLDTVRELNAQARTDRIITGQVDPTDENILLDGSCASAGDLVITRRNDRHLIAGRTGWVRNGDRWMITKIHQDGAVTIRRAGHTRGATVTLPAAYAAEHLDLGYAVTAHRAQGVTVDTCHILVTPTTTRENLYVAMTRGRNQNQAYVAIDRPDDTHDQPHPSDNPDATARTVLTGVLANSGAELSAHQMRESETERWGNTAQLRAEIETLIAAAQQDRWAALIAHCGLDEAQVAQVLDSEAFGPLCAEFRRAEANGIHPEAIMPKLVTARTLTGAADVASVLHARLTTYLDNTTADPRRRVAPRYLLGLIPQTSDRHDADMTQAITERADAMRNRATNLLQQATARRDPWLGTLGRRPADPREARRWDEAALAVAAYRDAWNVTSGKPLGEPSSLVQRQDVAQITAMLPTTQTRPTPGADPVGATSPVAPTL